MADEEFSLFLVKNSLIDKADDRFKHLMRWQDVDLFRRPLSYLFPADAHGRLDRLLDCDDKYLDGVLFPKVPLRVKTGGYINFDMKMERLGPKERRLDFYKPGYADPAPATKTPLTDMYSFFNFVEDLLNSPYEDDVGLTMVSVDALREGSALSEIEKMAARDEIEQSLRAKAVGGTLGVLDEASYGFLVSGGFDEQAYERELQAVAIRLELDKDTLAPRTASVDIDDRSMPSDQLRQALGHSRSVFVGEVEDEHGLTSLSAVVDGIQHNRKLVENALKNFHYQISSRSVLNTLMNTEVALLQQGKINLEGKIRRPDEILVMADHPDLSLQHDVAQLDDLLRMRRRKKPDDRRHPEFYEVCRSTVVQEQFFEKLADLLRQYNEVPGSVGFRVKGLPPVKRGGLHWHAINRLSELGHPVWLDRFGDAVIAPEALGCARGGYVEMPPVLMKKLAEHFDGKDLMEKLVKTWDGLGVGVLSCDLPDYELKTMAQEMGITVTVEDPF